MHGETSDCSHQGDDMMNLDGSMQNHRGTEALEELGTPMPSQCRTFKLMLKIRQAAEGRAISAKQLLRP